ncbi:hypothetical protein IV36_GL001768 [Liquorilactobacillus mali]|uniref:Uncharacterized protein n=2 Tax=Liquorilactobacillus mali TaxID=1618 RepID=A0A0R2G2N0_9LACO|nr:hypothetical protein IV36_GL001768 [Liquorilactobacillus mali]
MLLRKIDRNLIIMSQYLLKSEEHEEIYKIISSEDFYKNIDSLSDSTYEGIYTNRHLWIFQCEKEWKKGTGIFREDIRKLEVKPRCELCNTALRTEKYHIINRENGNSLWIGKECFEHILNNDIKMGMNDFTPNEAEKFERLKSMYSGLFKFVAEKPELNAEYEVSSEVIDLCLKLKRKINKEIRDTVKSNSTNRIKLKELLGKVDDAYKKIKFDISKKNEYSGFSNKLKARVSKNQTMEELDKIIKGVQQNHGFLDTNSASLIKDNLFLNHYMKLLKGLYGEKVERFDDKFNTFHFFLNYKSYKLRAKLNSRDTINAFGYDTENFKPQNNCENILFPLDLKWEGQETKDNLFLIGYEYLVNRKNSYKNYELRVGELESFIRANEIIGVNTEKVSRFLKSIVILRSRDKFFLCNASDIIMIGESVVKGQNILFNKKEIDNKKSLLQELFDRYYLKYNSR